MNWIHKIFFVFCFFFSTELENEIFSNLELSSKLKTLPIFGNVDRGVTRVNDEVPRLFKLHEDARRCFKEFQQVWYELEMFKVCRDDMPCEVKKNTPILLGG